MPTVILQLGKIAILQYVQDGYRRFLYVQLTRYVSVTNILGLS